MNLWIDIAHESLLRTIAMVDCVILNDGEVRQLTDEPNLVRAARKVLDMGPRVVVAKQGEYGSAMFTREGVFGCPAYPTPDVVDPTGAGDTFAGGFMGYVAAHAGEELTDELLRRAMAYGTALASFNVEAFGTERMQTLTGEEISGARRRAAADRAFDARAARAALLRNDCTGRAVRGRGSSIAPMGWTMLYLFVGLKIPIAAPDTGSSSGPIKQEPEPEDRRDDGGSRKARPHPRPAAAARPRAAARTATRCRCRRRACARSTPAGAQIKR